MNNWAIKNHIKGDTFNQRNIVFPFDITNCKIEMQFKQSLIRPVYFYWSTEDNTFEKISSTEVIMKSRLLDVEASDYISDLQVTFENGNVQTYLTSTIKIIQDVTT